MISAWWLVAVALFAAFGIAWLALSIADHSARIDQIDDDEDRHNREVLERLHAAEDWIRYLSDQARHGELPEPYVPEGEWRSRHIEVVDLDEPNFVVDVAVVDTDREADPATVPIPVGPATQPDMKAAAKVAPLAALSLDEMYAEAMASIDAIGKGSVTSPETIKP